LNDIASEGKTCDLRRDRAAGHSGARGT
jgi:hypothetical protein